MYKLKILLTHGAGAGTESNWFDLLSRGLISVGAELRLFDFEYMKEMKRSERRRPPSRFPNLVEEFKNEVMNEDPNMPLIIGGKSMGGRVSTQVASCSQVVGVVLFGYPFHALGKGMDERRVDQLVSCEKPTLIFQGKKDKMGSYEEVAKLDLPKNIEMFWVDGVGHDLVSGKDLKSSNNQPFMKFF